MVTPRRRLNCFMNGEAVGYWHVGGDGQDQFVYCSGWLNTPHRRPLSLSLPLRARAYRGAPVARFFDNLLPDHTARRVRLAARLGTEGPGAWQILTELGRDCAGAVQLIPEGTPHFEARLSGVPLRPGYLEKFLKVAPRCPVLRCLKTHYRVALAGQEEKTALLYYQGQWRLPTHSTPTTHIFKLPKERHQAENEWLCSLLLKEYGLPVSRCELHPVGERQALSVERFDRRWSSDGKRILRLPTEDLCQALAVPAAHKHEWAGGPGIRTIMDLLLGSSQPVADRADFFRSQLLYWMLGAVEGHAKNYSIFLEPGGTFRLAPRYDVVSSYPSPGRLSLAVGGEYAWERVGWEHWQRTARQCKFMGHWRALLEDLVRATPAVIELVKAQLPWDFPVEVTDSILGGLQRCVARILSFPGWKKDEA